MKSDFDQFAVDDYSQAAKDQSTGLRSEPLLLEVDSERRDRRGDHVRPGAFTSDQPTPYEKSDLAQSVVETEGRQALYNDRQPFYAIKHQKPEHLCMIYMKAEGFSNKEIADKMQVTPVCVANVLKQPWARKQLTDIIHKNGGNEVATLFKSAAADAAQLLVDQLGSEDEKVAQSAADKILDRVFGKASQPIEHSYRDEDLAKLPDAELLKLASGN